MGASGSSGRSASPPGRPAQGAAPGAGAHNEQPRAPAARGGYPGAQAYPGQPTDLRRPASFLEGMRPEMGSIGSMARTMAQPPQMQKTYTIRNDVNLKKGTLQLVRDASNAAHYHLEFVFDASTDCTIRVFYAALEKVGADGNVSFAPLKEAGVHPAESRGKGLNQTFRTRPSHPLDSSVYAEGELTTVGGGRFPIVVSLESTGGAGAGAGGGGAQQARSMVSSQTTFAAIVQPEAGGALRVVPQKQKIQVGTTSYELQEIYGIDGAAGAAAEGSGASAEQSSGADGESGANSRECVICMTEPRDTTVLPCRHMCMCSDCAKMLRVQSEKCPICRTPIEQLLQIKISSRIDAEAASGMPPAAQEAAVTAA